MSIDLGSILRTRASEELWSSHGPIREELFGVERLEEHGRSLATAQTISDKRLKVRSLQSRLQQNADVLLSAYQACAADLEHGRRIVPAAEWLLDNYHLVEQQVREVKDDLPPGFYKQLPKLSTGPLAGYPRVFGLAWAYVAHTDSHFDADTLCLYVRAYQSVVPLTIGELWAIAITIRIVLLENLRRLVDQISAGRIAREDADKLTERLIVSSETNSLLQLEIKRRANKPISEVFAAQFAKRLRDQDPKTTPALTWLEQRLDEQNVTIDSVVLHSQQGEGASNVSVRNVITSMRLMSDIDWAEQFERYSLVEQEFRRNSAFADMDFGTRNLYRTAIEELSRNCHYSELEVTKKVLTYAQLGAEGTENTLEKARRGDPGYYLLDEGRRDFERELQFRPSVSLRITRLHLRVGLVGYVGSIFLLALCMVIASLWFLGFTEFPVYVLIICLLLGFLPATEISTAILNRVVTWRLRKQFIPGLELKSGVPSTLRTLIAVPALLSNEKDLCELVESLEVHYLSGIAGDLSFALLLDGLDADTEVLETDEHLLKVVAGKIDRLNQHYGEGPAGKRFLLLYRRRQYNRGENKWMGWERKRGKLHELNRLLRGAKDTSFIATTSRGLELPKDVRFVITLDADTRMPREAALRLVGKMAHPLNRPRFNPKSQRVEAGYSIIQPRVTPSLPVGNQGSFYQRVISSPGGIDPYAAAASDVYQDLFNEGSYSGKGIYDIDTFDASLVGRVGENALLSHDLFEGIFARAALVSDVEVVEEFPDRYDVFAKRQHRWTRGDWQLLPWIFGRFYGPNAVSLLGRWKLVDNLRRSLIGPASMLAFLLSWLLPLQFALISTGLLLLTIAIPVFIPCVFSVSPPKPSIDFRHHLRAWLNDVRLAAFQVVFSLVFLADSSWRSVDAIVRTLFRLFISRRHLLEWTSCAKTNGEPRLNIMQFYQTMFMATLVSQLSACFILLNNPQVWPLVLPFMLAWLLAPMIAYWSSTSGQIQTPKRYDQYENDLRKIARKTWYFFERFVSKEDNMLPPDNFQETPEHVVAHRTSPTNIGLYLLSAVAARDFGWIGIIEFVERIEASFESLHKMAKYKGHFYNWYATQSLETLQPAYVSSVDSGNFAGHLIALANACDEWRILPHTSHLKEGLEDNLAILREIITQHADAQPQDDARLSAFLTQISLEISNLYNPEQDAEVRALRIAQQSSELSEIVAQQNTKVSEDYSELQFWIDACAQLANEYLRDAQTLKSDSAKMALELRLRKLARASRKMAHDMDFAFLMDKKRKLMSIGYSDADSSLDTSCYDLLASEARLASLFAIAKGDVSTKHWFHLGRTATPLGKGSALISWSGSMFEYLMPSLVMRAPSGSLLEQTNSLVVARQKQYADQLGIPWGISESAFNARDIDFTYQYSNFGVPGLGLKRGLNQNRVITPYATGLATMVAPLSALKNYERLKSLGAYGRYGFYEALDFTASRRPLDSAFIIVRSYMAHHQGMTIVAILNCLRNGVMRSRFHKEPCIQASELLLQERVPRNIAIGHPRAEEVRASTKVYGNNEGSLRYVDVQTTSDHDTPVTHLLSNGQYSVMVTASGAGFSRWRDFNITRWRSDSTCENDGSFIFLQDRESGQTWSPTAQALGQKNQFQPCEFAEDYAEFSSRHENIISTMEILVSGEDDAEVRRLSIKNCGHFSHDIDVTSFAELVLAKVANDNAHPAFSKMFVQTEFVEEYNAIVATKRKRDSDEPTIWVAHFACVEGESSSKVEYESSRANFIGRGNTLPTADALTQGASSERVSLTNTVGCVLDPIFALRYRVKVVPNAVIRLSFWTVVASSRSELIEMIDRHNDASAFDRAKTLAWTQAQVQLRHLGISAKDAADFQRLAAPILYNDPRFRSQSTMISRAIRSQSELWLHSISGDLPIVLLRIDDIEDIDQLKQLLRAHEYWRMKRLAVDIVIIDEHETTYRQHLHDAIDVAVRISQSRPNVHQKYSSQLPSGVVHVLRADLLTPEHCELLQAVACVVLVARRGAIDKQIIQHSHKVTKNENLNKSDKQKGSSFLVDASVHHANVSERPELEFDNGLGGFAKDGKEYHIRLQDGNKTPAPWVNVIANPKFGFHVSAEGSGYTWSENSRENKLSYWSNDAVSDPAGEIAYICDEDSGEIFSATAQPKQDKGLYEICHGFGYTKFEHEVNELSLSLLQFVPLKDPIKISRLTIHNRSSRKRRLSVTAYSEWVLGASRESSSRFTSAEYNTEVNAMLLRNRWGIGFDQRVAFADMAGKQNNWTSNRAEFIGRNGCLAAPQALCEQIPLSGQVGAGYDMCSALQSAFELEAGASCEIVIFLGQGDDQQHALELIKRYRQRDLSRVLTEVTQHWQSLLTQIQVKTPDRAMDIMLNGWLLYQTIACRIWARSSFYQSSGAYGFRDQLQDGLALTVSHPQMTREHLLRAAGRQFVEGDVQHWWLPHSGQGVRTKISDDRVWLTFATASYITTADDPNILNEVIPFLEGRHLDQDEHDAYFRPSESEQSASLFEHCARGLDQCIALTGEHGLPLMGSGDWNDGMNLVGVQGKGESVWLGWLLIRSIDMFIPHAEHYIAANNIQRQKGSKIEVALSEASIKNDGEIQKKNKQRIAHWVNHAAQLRKAINQHAWDGSWYRRATFDNGTWLGSHQNDECKIDAIAQSWSVLAEEENSERSEIAMNSSEQYLTNTRDGLSLLFTPAFDKTAHNPGYIKGYPPGLRENGGQYTHASMWSILALTKQTHGKKAVDLFSMLNPINHALAPGNVQRYKVEPYAVAADIYSLEPYVGRGGWTWYTGAAGWMYTAGISGILGIRREGLNVVIEPCIPDEWPSFSASLLYGDSSLDIEVNNNPPLRGSNLFIELNGVCESIIGKTITVGLINGHQHIKVYAKS